MVGIACTLILVSIIIMVIGTTISIDSVCEQKIIMRHGIIRLMIVLMVVLLSYLNIVFGMHYSGLPSMTCF